MGGVPRTNKGDQQTRDETPVSPNVSQVSPVLGVASHRLKQMERQVWDDERGDVEGGVNDGDMGKGLRRRRRRTVCDREEERHGKRETGSRDVRRRRDHDKIHPNKHGTKEQRTGEEKTVGCDHVRLRKGKYRT